jgi:hypothetical protein
MASTIAQRIEALDRAIATGLTSVSVDGETVTYRSLTEMQSIRNMLAAQIGLPAIGAQTVRVGTIGWSSGLGGGV